MINPEGQIKYYKENVANGVLQHLLEKFLSTFILYLQF